MLDQSHIICPILAGSELHPDAAALVGPTAAISYADLSKRVDSIGTSLGKRAQASGGRIGIYLSNETAALVALWACLRQGLLAVPLSVRLPVPEAAQQILDVGGRLVITRERSFGDGITVAHPDALAAGAPVGDAASGSALPMDRPWTALFTSGSSGTPRAVVHTVGAHLSNAEGSRSNITLSRGDRWLLSLPLYHVGGFAIAVRCWQAGATVVLPSGKPWQASALREANVTHISLVSTQLGRLLESLAQEGSVPSLRAVLLGGSAIPQSLLERAYKMGLPIHVSYGSTEMASQIATSPPGLPLEELIEGSGKLLPFRSIQFDEDGEVLVRGPTRFSGYLTRHGLDKPFDSEGWFATGDIGSWLGRGRIRIVGRKDRMFISGGENIHPEQIEKLLLQIRGIEDAVVVSVVDPEYGFRPVAFIRSSRHIERAEIEARLRQSLPGFMVPDKILPLPAPEADLKHDLQSLTARAEKELGR